ncbi:MAG: hypothetical protein ABOJ95_000701 [Wolbachia endosymbiont of Armadillidium vulgare]|uniref:hypothetical protein n=1 Tax=Wolbachia endosymbiont of Armadillidium vulgare TaxID=77039 RepID=UPI000911BA8B|nr:hypothetical protein [Wolbachia endosymbiont of Armadillidium vulgare]OJH31628.1 hypothetical protein Wxf_01022 [Wolbachia endosymbiont of Armadillidium vulgare]OJH32037.1 hypothetical protein Wxf_01456 [Wolbachia endosymbiont of Armadillidium vulgare]OJH32594.1 hypothetical protein Wxf_02036 [Wolbachia endosymbiont of Armadillidium vulgare]OJH33216.1 hypothetical protein Wxf_02690 [Wolbachia endosymbiont of Armadillidium vulgare]
MMKGFRLLINQIRLSWISLILKIKSFFQIHNTHHQTTASNGNDHTKKISIENKIEAQDNETDLEDIWYDDLEEQELDREEYFDAVESLDEQENSANIERDESNNFYSAKNLRRVQEFINHSNTFAIAIFEHSVNKLSGHYNDGNYQLASLQLSNDRESRACTLNLESKQSSIKISSNHMRLWMPFYFESKKQESIDYLFQYRNKNGDISTPGIVMLLEKPDSINLNPNFWFLHRTV